MMHWHVLTLFPSMFTAYFNEGLFVKAREKGLVELTLHDLREYSNNKYKSVDDRPYGGGSGMVLRADVVVPAIRNIKEKFGIDRVIYLSPRGDVLQHKMAVELHQYKNVLLVCGRYEGLDERAIELEVDQEISIGDYVLSGGELPAQVVIETASRLLPGFMGHEEAGIEESHADGLLEYPHYTRPVEFEGLKVPDVLLSGNHEEIKQWRREQSEQITKERRPDLINKKKL